MQSREKGCHCLSEKLSHESGQNVDLNVILMSYEYLESTYNVLNMFYHGKYHADGIASKFEVYMSLVCNIWLIWGYAVFIWNSLVVYGCIATYTDWFQTCCVLGMPKF